MLQHPAKPLRPNGLSTRRLGRLFALRDADVASLLVPLSAADDSLSRLDERLQTSPIHAGWIARTDFAEACAALWAEGSLVHLEDLVLHDANMDIRSPSHELTRAHAYLRLRRKAWNGDPKTLLSPVGLLGFIGRGRHQAGNTERNSEGDTAVKGVLESGVEMVGDTLFSAAIAKLKSATEAASGALERISSSPSEAPRDTFVYDEDWNEAGRLAEWCACLTEAERYPPVLGALALTLAWQATEPIQRQAWLAPLLAALYLRRRRRAKAHLISLHLGLRALRPKPGSAKTSVEQLQQALAIVEAAAREGLAQHDRLMLARQVLERKCKGRRENSKMPQLAVLLLNTPLVTAPMIAQELKISQQAAQNLIAELGTGLREITGRRRYRAWAIG
ncbi:MAG: hypothetical protein USCAAHI_01771 [Beijerinckiaceae bacterium]|nr:MAG: hypothetical protein USCAAHI_01771 [Beijerinckiaceae bacterium]